MSDFKKTSKSKFLANELSDLLNETQLEKTIPKRRAQKRQKPTTNEDDGDISKLIEIYQANSKKKKTAEDAFDSKESRQKILDVLAQQQESRKTMSTSFLTSLLDIITQLENDYEMLRENEQKLEHLASVFVKCIQQTSAAQKQNLNALKDIHNMFKKECNQMESNHKTETGKLSDELEADMNKLQQQLVAETKRKQFENLRRTIFHAIQNDL